MKTPLFALACSAFALTLSACGLTETTTPVSSGGNGEISVSSTSDACTLSATEASSGTLTFRVKNEGTEATEFYLYASDGLRTVGEVENIGPGLTRDLVVQVIAGDYVTACKPGMVGQGIRNTFTVTEPVSP
ncbi:cupredoxin domain-containing protein [Tessaracoccus antarcticus]|uniref:EfeO-type cupredoxin-like domain-containing protein n=1 Tax=Tessaracoccus antarcticus TaxID=2479848 RepID=A0A3M0FX51_9ACTN|nr:cupredoxin domain-containing protein [Tessaracoccus antarcticus]RMB57048.1 hypothetical protein EAX62_16240 [Tessaracoccus antarcticus]